jgi:hypothetical protein
MHRLGSAKPKKIGVEKGGHEHDENSLYLPRRCLDSRRRSEGGAAMDKDYLLLKRFIISSVWLFLLRWVCAWARRPPVKRLLSTFTNVRPSETARPSTKAPHEGLNTKALLQSQTRCAVHVAVTRPVSYEARFRESSSFAPLVSLLEDHKTQGLKMEIDLHGYYPYDVNLTAIVQQAWEMGCRDCPGRC